MTEVKTTEYYQIVEENEIGTVLVSIKKVTSNKIITYDFEHGEIRVTEDSELFSFEGEKISKYTFLNLRTLYKQLIEGKTSKEIEKFIPKSKFHLFNDEVDIYGYSSKTRKELTHFIEIYGRKNGFRVLDEEGITAGFVTAELLSNLSYSLTDDLR